jgi:hypothetical protein
MDERIKTLEAEIARLLEALEETQDALDNLLHLQRIKGEEGKIDYYKEHSPLAWADAEKAEEKARKTLEGGLE